MSVNLPDECSNCNSRGPFEVDENKWGLARIDDEAHVDMQMHLVLLSYTCQSCGLALLFNPQVAGDFRRDIPSPRP